jgi:hypothetical protein
MKERARGGYSRGFNDRYSGGYNNSGSSRGGYSGGNNSRIHELETQMKAKIDELEAQINKGKEAEGRADSSKNGDARD